MTNHLVYRPDERTLAKQVSLLDHLPFAVIRRTHPVVVAAVAGPLLEETTDLLAAVAPRPLYFVCLVWWSAEVDSWSLTRQYHRLRRLHGKFHYTYLCNSQAEKDVLDVCGLPTLLCNHNAFVDYNLFRIRRDMPKRYKAVYNAAFAPYKRHYLCRSVPNLLLLGYADSLHAPYVSHVANLLPHATWGNRRRDGSLKWLGPAAICRLINQAGVGLCLSQAEGAMYSSVEYLLCGLPVVSTQSLGGRDTFFDPAYVTIVGDSPAEVARGVEVSAQTTVAPGEIRNRTVARMRRHRRSLTRYIAELCQRYDAPRHSPTGLAPRWPNRLVSWVPRPRIASLFTERDRPR